MVEIKKESSIRCCKKSLKTMVSNEPLSSEDITTTPEVRSARVSGDSKLKSSFDELLSVYLKENCPDDCIKPLPPMLGDGHSVDLLTLYSIVKQKGGFEAVSDGGLWGEVGLLYGIGPTFGSAIKLIYFQYLGSLEHWLVKLIDIDDSEREWSNCGEYLEGVSVELECAFSCFVCDIVDEMRANSEDCVPKTMKCDLNFFDLTKENEVKKKLKRKKIRVDFAEVVDSTDDNLKDEKLKRKNNETSFANDVVLLEGNHVVKKLKRKNNKTGFANDVILLEGNHAVKKLKRNKTNTTANSNCFYTELNNDNKLEKTKSEMTLADNLITSSTNSDACKKSCTQIEDNSKSVGSVMLKGALSEMSFAHCSNVKMSSLDREGADGIFESSENLDTSEKNSTGVVEKSMNQCTSVKEISNHEIQQVDPSRMLHWMAKISKNPTDSEIDMILEKKCLKQVLLAREALFLKRNQVSASEQFPWQKKHKMHPSMYDDQIKSAERSSPRLISSHEGRFRVARLDLQPTASIYMGCPQKKIPVGRDFQAEIAEWILGASTESDYKWLGTRVWPPKKRPKKSLIETRVDTSCRCQFRGSTECVKFHISARRTKMKLELGPVFNAWNFDKMGEECSNYWTADEEKKFKGVIKEKPDSLYRCFGHQMSKVLPRKCWVDQVNYYYNVFVLRRRGTQNRLSSCNIDSDDDETEYRTPSNHSGFRT